ncbi:hypothetical protein FWD07_02070 [Candidatus Saccharibacteria bacterium]|nr:hypothetical protein [Candidatus Saccharibacteria bacterium]
MIGVWIARPKRMIQVEIIKKFTIFVGEEVELVGVFGLVTVRLIVGDYGRIGKFDGGEIAFGWWSGRM